MGALFPSPLLVLVVIVVVIALLALFTFGSFFFVSGAIKNQSRKSNNHPDTDEKSADAVRKKESDIALLAMLIGAAWFVGLMLWIRFADRAVVGAGIFIAFVGCLISIWILAAVASDGRDGRGIRD